MPAWHPTAVDWPALPPGPLQTVLRDLRPSAFICVEIICLVGFVQVVVFWHQKFLRAPFYVQVILSILLQIFILILVVLYAKSRPVLLFYVLLELGWLGALVLQAQVISRLRDATRLLGDWLAVSLLYTTILAFLLQLSGFLVSLLSQHAWLGHAMAALGTSLIQLMVLTCMIALIRRSAFSSEKRRMRYVLLSAGLCGFTVFNSVLLVFVATDIFLLGNCAIVCFTNVVVVFVHVKHAWKRTPSLNLRLTATKCWTSPITSTVLIPDLEKNVTGRSSPPCINQILVTRSFVLSEEWVLFSPSGPSLAECLMRVVVHQERKEHILRFSQLLEERDSESSAEGRERARAMIRKHCERYEASRETIRRELVPQASNAGR